MSKGVIYILTNPSFPQYVKIGYATDVKQRLDELNRSSAVPFAFRVYATYEVDSALSDKKLHSILDKLNPELRSTEEVDGKRRIREFYAMTPEDAYAILEAIAEINATLLGLHKGQIVTVVYYGVYEQIYLQLTGPVTKVDSYWKNLQIGNTTIEFPEIDQLLTDVPALMPINT